MDLSALKTNSVRNFAALFALTMCAGTMQATVTLTATAPGGGAINVACSTATGPTTASIVVKPIVALTGVHAIVVTFTAAGSGLTITAPTGAGATTLNLASQAAGLTYTIAAGPNCVGASTGPVTLHFSSNLDAAGAQADVAPVANVTVTSTASALVAPAIVVTCARSAGPVYVPGPAATVSVTSSAIGGTPFTVDTVTAPLPAWLVLSSAAGGTATASPITFTVTIASGCNALPLGTTTQTIHLLNGAAPDKLVTVSVQIVPPTPLTATPNPASLTYVKGSGNAGHADVNVTSSVPSAFFAVNTASLPIWLTVDLTTGVAPKSIRFSSTNVADSLAPGTYSATIYLKVSGYADLGLPVSLLITNKAPRLSVSEGTTRNINWTLGSTLPAPFVTAVSTDSPIPYSVTTGGTLAPIVSAAQQSGLAYSYGTQIGISFNPLVFAAAQPGSTLTGTVTLTWGSPAATVVVSFNIAVLSPGATLSSISPASLPTAATGQTFTVVLTGSGFAPSSDPAQKTKVGIVVGGSIVTDTNISANVVNPSNIILTITVPAVADANLPFAPAGAGGPVPIGICNPAGGTCSIPTGTATLTISGGPIVQAVTSASAYQQVSAPALQNVAPYDMISIFGASFCSSGGTGCTSSQILYGAPDPVALRYSNTLSPDAPGATQRSLTVTFTAHLGSSVIATAPLLFATNNQINILVPAALFGSIGSPVDMYVNFGYGAVGSATMKTSAPVVVNVTATDPGVFTVGADGQGDGAILNSNYAQVTPANPAGIRSTGSDSDTVAIYVTGLGSPDGTASNASAGGGAWPTDCITVASYLTSLNGSSGSALTDIDGTVIQSALLNAGRLPPCIKTANIPTVSIGGTAATVVYAGFVADSPASLYQINAQLPASGAGFTSVTGQSIATITAPVQLPVVVTANGLTSQTGVTVWVAPRLKVAAPSGAGLTGTVGIPWSVSSNVVVATEGTGTYRYAVTSGVLPAGLTLTPNGVNAGKISGTPAANTAGVYAVTVTATDSANIPVTGTVTFSLTVAGGLFMTSSGVSPYLGTFGTVSASLTTVTATGGVFPYVYTITSTPVTGMTVGAASGIVGITALTPAGGYTVTVTATDSTAGTPLTGTITFGVDVALHMARTAPVNGAAGVASAISTVSVTGNTGTPVYTLDAATLALPLGWVTIDSSTGIVSVTTDAPASTNVTATVTATDGSLATGATTAATGTITVAIHIP